MSRTRIVKDASTILTVTVIAGLAIYAGPSSTASSDPAVDMWVVLSFVPMLFVSGLQILAEVRRRPFSLHLMHLLFLYLFFGVAPLAQYTSGSFPLARFFPFDISAQDLLVTNLVLFAWIGIYTFAYSRRRQRDPRVGPGVPPTATTVPYVLQALVAVVALGYLASMGMLGVLSRGGYAVLFDEGGTWQLIVTIFVRGIPVIALAALIVARSKVSGLASLAWGVVALAFLAANILLNNPLAAARYWTGTVLIGLVAIMTLRRQKTAAVLVPALLFGITVLMPLLNQSRVEVQLNVLPDTSFVTDPTESFLTGDFDAYSMTLLTLRYVEVEGASWGWQLLGSLLFFVPRVYWPNKPVGSGAFVSEYFGFQHTNVSCPLPAEALVNFSWLGVIAWAWLFGCLLHRLDEAYWVGTSPRLGRLLEVVYPFWLGLTVFLSRGDFMSSFAFTVGTTAAALPLLLGSSQARRPRRQYGASPLAVTRPAQRVAIPAKFHNAP